MNLRCPRCGGTVQLHEYDEYESPYAECPICHSSWNGAGEQSPCEYSYRTNSTVWFVRQVWEFTADGADVRVRAGDCHLLSGHTGKHHADVMFSHRRHDPARRAPWTDLEFIGNGVSWE